MAERKQRITRKYLRERQEMAESGLALPVDSQEDERITASEKFKEVELDLNRKSPAAPPPAPVVRAVPAQAQPSWMLEDDPDADPYADPFAPDEGGGLDEGGSDWWTQWQMRQADRAARTPAGSGSGYSSADRDVYTYGDQTRSGYGYQQDRSSGYSYGSPRTSYGQRSDNSLGPYGSSRYGSSSSDGMLTLPPPSQSDADGLSGSSLSGAQPYKSPYQSQQDRSRQQQPRQQEESFSRPAPYQQWKDRNKQWDPTADDAYLNELMRRNRR